MRVNKDLIVFGEDWGALPTSTQHLVKQLATRRKVLWVNSIGLRQPKFNRHDISRAMTKLLGKSKAAQMPLAKADMPSQMKVVTLRTIPAPRSKGARALAVKLMKAQLLPMIEKMNLIDPILWTSLPTAADLCGQLGESAIIYYCGDDFSALAGVDHQTVHQHEQALASKADLILTASDKLAQKFPSHKSHIIPHGVDLELFTTPSPRAQDLPNNGRPIAGFYGSLSQWLDYDLIQHLALRLPNWDFVFIGPNELSQCQLPKLANVYYLGPKPHHQLPQYSQHWDVSLLPFIPNQQIQACNPLKLLEYLAVERPVVATPFPALAAYDHWVAQTSNVEDFCQALSQLKGSKIDSSEALQAHSWKNRAETIEQLVRQL
ncbi:glycosyltransferase [Vibrio sp. SCSIO 43136]|uniref:glycosyltransferase n=1 Tax=Vibrio sp. SCSIO 43136 TaxID=2819101 RepID=UPI002075A600|nr:glycosyltransferase [Vibrio sp. SCSIO 43136]USD67791.1 glycosyltransferase [Vibrio sp. SCSIO 43136]